MLRRKIHFVFSVLSIVLWTIFSTTRAQTVPERQIKIIGLLAPDTVRVQRGQKIPLQVSLLHVGGVKIRVMKDPQLERIETLYVSWISPFSTSLCGSSFCGMEKQNAENPSNHHK